MADAARPEPIKAALVCDLELSPEHAEYRFQEWVWRPIDKRLPRTDTPRATLPGDSEGGVFCVAGLKLILPEWARYSRFGLTIGPRVYLEGDAALLPIEWRGDLIVPPHQVVYVGLTVFQLHMRHVGTKARALLAGKWWPSEDAYFGRS